MFCKSKITKIIAGLVVIVAPSLAFSDSRTCASDIAKTGDAGLVKAFRTFRGACASYQGCVQKVTSSANTALSCRNECASKSQAQKQQCISSCLGQKAKSSQLRKKIDQSCSDLRSGNQCKQATIRFDTALTNAGKKATSAKNSCEVFMGKK